MYTDNCTPVCSYMIRKVVKSIGSKRRINLRNQITDLVLQTKEVENEKRNKQYTNITLSSKPSDQLFLRWVGGHSATLTELKIINASTAMLSYTIFTIERNQQKDRPETASNWPKSIL